MMTLTGTAAEAHNKRRLKKESRLFIQETQVRYAEMGMLIVRWACGWTRMDMVRNEDIGEIKILSKLILICFNPEIQKHLVGIRHFLKFMKDPVTVSLVRHQQTLTMFTVSQK
ncbi:hypothetical protein TELCIR_01129 [Teladorsagia circumcincta]|uniref:Uncharacterized protein n=1 Tax=Teladorsagia circumcincta TaxID=45464 RepID=A0A2G9V312_TELCI|nr:hypothetical protein TELCIR_01129 [Teladorsagia circumcincta]